MMKKWKLIIFLIWIVILIFPVLFGYYKSNNEFQFAGLIFNPIDGFSYFAKMQQGFSGNWSFQLPYSPRGNSEIFIFTLYIFFGHLSRILGLSIPFVFHFFRLLFSILLFFTLLSFLKYIYKQEDIYFKGAFISLLFGGGLGWIYFLSGDLPVDFWVAEAFVFLSSFSTPHFSLTFLLMILAMSILVKKTFEIWMTTLIFLLSIILVSISPFASVIIGFLYGINIFLGKDFLKEKIVQFISFGIPAVSIGVYQYETIRSDPVLNIWNSQNVTLTPSIINLLITLLPFLLGSIVLLFSIRYKIKTFDKPIILLISWILFSLIMAYVPFNLQRRFLVGIYVPLVIIFWHFLKEFVVTKQKTNKTSLIIFFISIIIPSNILIFAGSVNAIRNLDSMFYVKTSLIEAMDWANEELNNKSVFLSNEELGLLIPAYGNFQVVYGHPFESINADEIKIKVNDFWSNKMSLEDSIDFYTNNNIEYILCNYDNSLSDCPSVTQTMEIIYDLNKIVIFQVSN